MNSNLYASFQAAFPADPSKPFLKIPGANGEISRIVTYADLDEKTARFAGCLLAFGTAFGDRVLVQVEKSPEAVFVYLACLRIGAIFVPLNTAYTAKEMAYFIGDAKPKILVCKPESQGALSSAAKSAGVTHTFTMDAQGKGDLTDAALAADPHSSIAPVYPDDLAAIIYTSGTTGRSKGAMLTHANLLSNARTLHSLWQFQGDDVLLHCLPIYHVHGLFVALHCALLNASTVFFLDRFDTDLVVSLIPESTVLMGVPTYFHRMLNHPGLTPQRCRNMRLFISGSAPMLAQTHRQFKARTGQRILERYGMTEGGMVASNPYDGERVAGTVGFALPDVTIEIRNKDGLEVPRGTIGALEYHGPNTFAGYWKMPEKTAEEFRDDGFFISGDLATMDEHGRISIVGRSKDLIISGGINVYPKEVEDEISSLSGVEESAVIGAPHPDFGEGITAIVVRSGEITENSLLEYLAGNLAPFKIPKRVFFVDELPRNAMGKVQKNILRETYKDTFEA